mmetsp:Transcript_63538/g.182453  ORF Transcript_63538/g.182453 Transcript_63538/m.182453 type:complete len:375 (-) Transcript_63538:1158-2282(-)
MERQGLGGHRARRGQEGGRAAQGDRGPDEREEQDRGADAEPWRGVGPSGRRGRPERSPQGRGPELEAAGLDDDGTEYRWAARQLVAHPREAGSDRKVQSLALLQLCHGQVLPAKGSRWRLLAGGRAQRTAGVPTLRASRQRELAIQDRQEAGHGCLAAGAPQDRVFVEAASGVHGQAGIVVRTLRWPSELAGGGGVLRQEDAFSAVAQAERASDSVGGLRVGGPLARDGRGVGRFVVGLAGMLRGLQFGSGLALRNAHRVGRPRRCPLPHLPAAARYPDGRSATAEGRPGSGTVDIPVGRRWRRAHDRMPGRAVAHRVRWLPLGGRCARQPASLVGECAACGVAGHRQREREVAGADRAGFEPVRHTRLGVERP